MTHMLWVTYTLTDANGNSVERSTSCQLTTEIAKDLNGYDAETSEEEPEYLEDVTEYFRLMLKLGGETLTQVTSIGFGF